MKNSAKRRRRRSSTTGIGSQNNLDTSSEAGNRITVGEIFERKDVRMMVK